MLALFRSKSDGRKPNNDEHVFENIKLNDYEIKDSIRKSIKYVTKTIFSRDPIINIHIIRIND